MQFAGEPLGVALAFANALLFAAYIVLAHRVARHGALSGIDGLAASMLVAAVVVTPLGGWEVLPALTDPVALLAGIGVGLCSSVIPYVSDQLAMRRLPRATYALMVSLLPATATVIGIAVLAQIPSWVEVAGVGLVIAGVAIHRQAPEPQRRKALQRNQQSGGPGPVLSQQLRAGTPEQSAQHQCHQDRVVQLARHRDEVRHEVERHGQVDERERRPDLPATWHARVLEQPLEEDRAVGNQPGDHADVPLAGADHQRGDQGRVDRDQHGEAEEQPAHRAPRIFRTCSSWVFGETFGITSATVPSGSMTNVARWAPQ